ncbi:MAG TPA: ABC transporter permease [Hellea balneolensis]|uniref:Transport permease protein n=1 Tax=Hellea balneolensis TaxID=287478 RepID=A0A7C5LT40_9PROT|nr:ABC transporter permease [Hellea balneolensis]
MKHLGFFIRIWAIFVKELTQMRRDKLTFAMMVGVPVMQLMLFGFAINTDPKHLPTAVLVEEQSPIIRTMLTALETSEYFDFVLQTDDPRESTALLARGDVAFVVNFPSGFTRKLVRGERPQILIEADASDPSAASNAMGHAQIILSRALHAELDGTLRYLAPKPDPFELIIHPKYNPEGITHYNIVPGLLGVILTMTLVMITSMAMTRETERGTLENLLALPAKPAEVMIGKITPYVAVGAVQTAIILLMARFVFDVPFAGEMWVLMLGVVIFVIANLALGFTFSTLAETQMQAMQLTFFFFLPSILLSGFMFPFRGMPSWAQHIGEMLPLTHFLRVVRGVMLKGVSLTDIRDPMMAMGIFTIIVSILAMVRYRRTLD